MKPIAWKKRDPFYSREKEKYGTPVPSREFLLEQFKIIDRPIELVQMFEVFDLASDTEREGLKIRIRAMVREGELIRNRNGELLLVEPLGMVVGKVRTQRDGSGLIYDEKHGEDVVISQNDMRRVLHGDTVAVQPHQHPERAFKNANVIEVVERADWVIVGRYHEESGVGWITPENPFLTNAVMVTKRDKTLMPELGQWVTAKLIEPPTERNPAVANITSLMEDDDRPGLETDIAIIAHGLPNEWSDSVLKETEAFGDEVKDADKANRLDLRDKQLVTIDGADAKDFDDAVLAEPAKIKGKDGWRLWVAIADVSHYVKPKAPLDDEAQTRGRSVYFPRRVVPMLPEALSNGLCSLNPLVDRLCMVCEMRVDHLGNVVDSKFHEAVMRSHARLTYNQVEVMLRGDDEDLKKKYSKVLPSLHYLNDVFQALLKARSKRGALDFDFPSMAFVFDDLGKVESIKQTHRNDTHRLIEECMVSANVEAAKFLTKHKIPGLFRVHEPPSSDRLDELREFLSLRGISLPKVKHVTPKHYSAVQKEVAGRDDAETLLVSMLRSMMQANYQAENLGHFGLALENYAHFTSPIRRYPDLLVHRAIRHVLRKKPVKEYDYKPKKMASLGKHCSVTERRAEDASRDANDWLQCEFMERHIGQVFEGEISKVKSFGLFVRLKANGVSGMAHVSGLGSDYFIFNEAAGVLKGKRTGLVFAPGNTVQVKVSSVNKDKRFIDFEVISENMPKRKPSEHRKSSKKRGRKKPAASSRTRGKAQGKAKRKAKAKPKYTRSVEPSANKKKPNRGSSKKRRKRR